MKEAKLAAESDAREKEDDGIDIPLVPPEMQVDGLAEKDELVAQLKQQIAATEHLKEREGENNGELKMCCSVYWTMWLLLFVAFIS